MLDGVRRGYVAYEIITCIRVSNNHAVQIDEYHLHYEHRANTDNTAVYRVALVKEDSVRFVDARLWLCRGGNVGFQALY